MSLASASGKMSWKSSVVKQPVGRALRMVS